MASMSARTIHTIADELKVDPELVGALILEHKLRSKDAVRKAVTDYLAAQSGNGASADGSEEPKAPRKKKAGLTLSQRRALLRLLDADGVGVSPASAFKSLPYEHLVDIGYADRLVLDENGDDVTNDEGIGVFTLTSEGRERAESINPGYRDWSAGETVVLDDEGEPVVRDEDGNPIRPPAGTHRRTKAELAAEKAKAEAEAKAKADAEAAKKAEEDAAKKDEDEDENDVETKDASAEVVTA